MSLWKFVPKTVEPTQSGKRRNFIPPRSIHSFEQYGISVNLNRILLPTTKYLPLSFNFPGHCTAKLLPQTHKHTMHGSSRKNCRNSQRRHTDDNKFIQICNISSCSLLLFMAHFGTTPLLLLSLLFVFLCCITLSFASFVNYLGCSMQSCCKYLRTYIASFVVAVLLAAPTFTPP